EDPEEPGDGDESGGVWFSGEGEPEADLGDEGDFYLDESTGDYYKKTSEGWELRGNFKGEDGEDGEVGTIWFVDEGEPEADLGDEGDFYLDESTGDYYKKTSEGWELRGNLKGEDGEDGEVGTIWFVDEGEPEADQGDEGDFYLDELTGDYYKKTSEGWELRGNYKGEDGEDGEVGTIWFVDEGEPEADLGDEGDFYLDELTGDYYKKTSEGWELRGNLKGED